MTDNTPTSNERLLLDVIGTVPSDWALDVTYPTLPDVTHQFPSLPELVLTTTSGTETHEIAVEAVITDDQVFRGYAVTTTYPEPGRLTAACRERRLTALSQQELLSKGVDTDLHPTGDTGVAEPLSLSAAASLAGYYAATIDPDPGEEHAGTTVSTAGD